jgi:hypothetical protein
MEYMNQVFFQIDKLFKRKIFLKHVFPQVPEIQPCLILDRIKDAVKPVLRGNIGTKKGLLRHATSYI